MDDLQDVSVRVPTDRLGEFYRWFGRWLDGAEEPGETTPPAETVVVGPWNPAEDLELAARAWQKFPARARQVLSTLIDNPDRRYWAEHLAELHQIPNGRFGLAGALAWPGRTLRGMGRPLPISSEPDARGGSVYWMTPSLAGLFGEARRRSADAPGRP